MGKGIREETASHRPAVGPCFRRGDEFYRGWIMSCLWCTMGTALLSEREHLMSRSSYFGTTPAPDFPEGLAWLNTQRPITMEELKGKIVILDFWTYC